MSEKLTKQQTPEQVQEKVKKDKKNKKPKGWIRWSGLITFLLIAGLVIGLIYLIGSWTLKNKLENIASEAWGAKVEISSIGFGLNPIGLKVDGLALTDTEQPMQNLIEIEKIRFTVNLYHAVVGRFVMEDVALNGLKLNQPRRTSGALPKAVEKTAKPEEKTPTKDSTPTETQTAASSTESVSVADSGSKKAVESENDNKPEESKKLPSMAMPDASEILAREKLETVEHAKQIEQRLSQVQQEWQEIEKNLPTAEKLASYQTELEALFSGSIKNINELSTKQKSLQEIEKRWQQDQAIINKAQTFIRENSSQISADIALLQKLPDQDLQRLLSSYSLDESGLKNITYLLFGESVQEKMELALDWYRKAQPLLAWIKEYRAEQAAKAKASPPKPRFEGEWVEFEEYDPQPKFMIKRVSFDGEIDWGQVKAKMWDVNFDHKNSKKPVRFALFAQPKTQQTGLVLEGESSAVATEQVITQGHAKWQDFKVDDWWMVKTKDLAINLAKADVQVASDFQLIDLQRIESQMILNYENVKFDLSDSDSNEVKTYMSPAFDDVDHFKVNAGFNGKVLAPGLSAHSDLDAKLAKGFKRVFNQQVAQFKRDLQAQLNAKLNEVKAPLDKELKRLGLDLNSLDDQQKMLQNLESQADKQVKQVENEITGRIEAEKKKLEQQAQQRLAEEQKKLEQQKKKAEADAKKRLENELRKRLPF